MIARVTGELVEKTHNSLIIDVNGIGYEVQVAAGDYEITRVGARITLHTHDHLRETAHELFGFSRLADMRLFESLILVSGVGPKMALAILSLGDSGATRNAIAAGDSAYVQRAAGVGKRLAERVVVDLKDKVGAADTGTYAAPIAGQRDDALDALLALGYNLQQASTALAAVDSALDTPTKVKKALQLIGG